MVYLAETSDSSTALQFPCLISFPHRTEGSMLSSMKVKNISTKLLFEIFLMEEREHCNATKALHRLEMAIESDGKMRQCEFSADERFEIQFI